MKQQIELLAKQIQAGSDKSISSHPFFTEIENIIQTECLASFR